MPCVVHVTTVHHVYDPRILYKQCHSLKEAGYTVHLIAQHTRTEVLNGVHIEALPVVGKSWRVRLGLQSLAYKKARALDADLYHFHDPELIPLAYAVKRATGARVIYDMHEDYLAHGFVQGRLLRLVERWCFSWIDHIIVANGMQHRSSMGTKVTVVANYLKPHGPPPAIRRMPSSVEPLRLLYTGVIAEMRGLFDMIELAKAIKERRLNWVIDLVGVVYREADRKKAEHLIEAYQVDTIIRRVGWNAFVKPEDMQPFYEQAHIGLALLHPQTSYMSTIPTKFYEYTYHGLPIVCSAFPVWKAFIRKHNCGVGVSSRLSGVVIAAIGQILETSYNYRKNAEQGQQATLRHYLWKNASEQLLCAYDQLVPLNE